MAEAPPTIEPLHCPACGAAVALADQERLSCPYCDAVVEVPAAHREALRAARDAASARVLAKELYATLGAPPGWFLRICAFVFGTWLRILFSFLLVSGALLTLEVFLMFAVGALLHDNVFETQSGGRLVDLTLLPIWVAAMLLITALGVYGRRVALDRRALQVALSARPPAHPGGPASCRECGGPLHVGPTDLGVRCLYCGADNLVALPSSWLGAFTGQVARAEREIEQVQKTVERDRRRRRRSLLGHLVLVSAILGAWLGSAIWLAAERRPFDDFPPHWSDYIGDPRPVLRRETRTVMTRVQMPPSCASVPDYLPDGCSGPVCAVRLYLALRHGEQIRMHNRGRAPLDVAVSWHYFAGWPDRPGGRFGHRLAAVSLAPGAERKVASDWSAWYELEISSRGDARTPVGLCVSVAAP